MKKMRGFKLGHRSVVAAFRWIVRPRRKYLSRLFSFIRWSKRLCHSDQGSSRVGKILLGRENSAEQERTPKGYMVLYVGESEKETCRVVVPVVYLNHPLFGELLKESERVYGFNHAGGITIPCRVAEFQKVQMRIAAWGHQCRRRQLRLA